MNDRSIPTLRDDGLDAAESRKQPDSRAFALIWLRSCMRREAAVNTARTQNAPDDLSPMPAYSLRIVFVAGRQDFNLRPPGPQPERSNRTRPDSVL